MRILSYFIPFLGFINAIKNRKNLSLFLYYILASFVQILILFFIYLILKKYISPERFVYFGHIPFCNKKPERAIQLGGFVFPLCCRCMFFILGLYGILLVLFVFQPKRKMDLIILGILCLLPCLIDGLIQTVTSYVSSNLKRSIFGFLCGLGTGYIVYMWIDFILNKGIKKTSSSLN